MKVMRPETRKRNLRIQKDYRGLAKYLSKSIILTYLSERYGISIQTVKIAMKTKPLKTATAKKRFASTQRARYHADEKFRKRQNVAAQTWQARKKLTQMGVSMSIKEVRDVLSENYTPKIKPTRMVADKRDIEIRARYAEILQVKSLTDITRASPEYAEIMDELTSHFGVSRAAIRSALHDSRTKFRNKYKKSPAVREYCAKATQAWAAKKVIRKTAIRT